MKTDTQYVVLDNIPPGFAEYLDVAEKSTYNEGIWLVSSASFKFSHFIRDLNAKKINKTNKIQPQSSGPQKSPPFWSSVACSALAMVFSLRVLHRGLNKP